MKVGRLFWKFFLTCWLAVGTAGLAVGVVVSLYHSAEMDRRNNEIKSNSAPLIKKEQMHKPSFGPPGPPPHRRGLKKPPPGPSIWIPITLGGLSSILFSALLAWYMAKPIRHLRHAFSAAAKGDLEVRVQPLMGTRRDEIADLGQAYDHMASRLKTLIDAQRNLFHDVSHELRSPLARLHAAIGLAHQDPKQITSSLTRIETEANRLDALVGELLTLARLNSGTPTAKKHEVDLFNLVDSIVEDARFEASANNIQIHYNSQGKANISGQEDLLGQAFENIIRNAIKYTPADSEITIDTIADNTIDFFQLSVTDQGPGINEAEQDAIFEPFYRAHNANHRDGYGLGLAIAHRVIEAHGGTIEIHNMAEGGLQVNIKIALNKD